MRTCSEPRSVERRLSFAIEVTTTSGNWKHPLPLKIIFNARFQWLLCFKNGWYLTPPTLRHPWTAPQKCVSRTYIYIYVYVIARVGVKFGINFTSVRLSGNKIARGEAECYLPLNLTRVKFVPEISRLTVLLKINTIASLLFI